MHGLHRLSVGDFPLATVPFPLGCRRLTQPAFNFIGADCDSVAPVKLEPIAFGKQVPLSVRYEGERGKAGGSGFVSAVVEEHPEAVESEPNDTPESATRLPALPVALSGRFDRPNDRDFYQLPVKMGDRLTFAARTRSLGSPCDVRLG